MKIGIIRETKVPEDYRVALTPNEIVSLQQQFANAEFVVQSSPTRAYSDEEYRSKGVTVRDNIDDCDLLLGIKEAKIETLLPNKHYFFFGHIAKMQPYNKPLLQKMIAQKITFSDYEYLVDDKNQRLCAFGWWAGVVGVYNTLRAYGIRTNKFNLPAPDRQFTLERLISTLQTLPQFGAKIMVTGNGRVSHGAQHVLDTIGCQRVSPSEFLTIEKTEAPIYTVADVDLLVKRKDAENLTFDLNHFIQNPEVYESAFFPFAKAADILLCCHFWAPQNPVYLSETELKCSELRISVIGDVTCDILGSVKSTLRASTHAEPFYDYNPATAQEEPPFSSAENITVMAVDTLPNALAIDTSSYFGEALSKYVMEPILKGNLDSDPVIERATILKNGELTERFSYLKDFVEKD